MMRRLVIAMVPRQLPSQPPLRIAYGFRTSRGSGRGRTQARSPLDPRAHGGLQTANPPSLIHVDRHHHRHRLQQTQCPRPRGKRARKRYATGLLGVHPNENAAHRRSTDADCGNRSRSTGLAQVLSSVRVLAALTRTVTPHQHRGPTERNVDIRQTAVVASVHLTYHGRTPQVRHPVLPGIGYRPPHQTPTRPRW